MCQLIPPKWSTKTTRSGDEPPAAGGNPGRRRGLGLSCLWPPQSLASNAMAPRNADGKALVRGGAGFIGSHLCERLLDNDWEVWALDDLP
jgi:hypothetical protein